MSTENVPLIAFNRGIISPLALARIDIKRVAMSAEEQTNWMPRLLGSTMLRPGFEYIVGTKSNLQAVHVPFIFSSSDTAILQFTNTVMRVLVDDVPITRVSVTTAFVNASLSAYVANGTFDTDTIWTKGAGWTIAAGVATATGAISTALTQTSGVTLITGKSYSITYTVTRSAGSVAPTIGGTAGVSRSTNATFTETIVAGATQTIGFTGTGFTGTIDTVSIEPINTGWLDTDESGATSTVTGGFITLVGDSNAAAIREQTLTIAGGDQNKEHAIRITVTKGIVVFSVGSTSGDDDYITRAALGVGIHSLAFTPTGASAFVRVASATIQSAKISSVAIEAAGIMEITTPWLTADLPFIRTDESADVVYVACTGYQQRKIERRAIRSWSVVLYQPVDGPLSNPNISSTRLTPSAISGDITLTASRAHFKSTSVGALYSISSTGQFVTRSATAEDEYTDPIRVTGIGAARTFTIDITGTWVATITLQRSDDDGATWTNVSTYTTNQAALAYTDGLDNQILSYRLGIRVGGYTSGTAVLSLTYTAGSITGIIRITAYTSSTSVTAEVLKDLGGTTSTVNWSEGQWSDRRGWPSAVCLHGGRLWWAGKSIINGSVSDAYESYDDTVIGDSGPIARSIGSGPVDVINWLMRIKRLVIGTDAAEWVCQSSNLDDPLTPSSFGMDDPSTQGSAHVAGAKLDDRGLFVQKSGTKLFEIKNSGDVYGTYASSDLSELTPELCLSGIQRIAVQRTPDTRVHCVLGNGKVAVLVSDPTENVLCWVLVETDGVVEDAFVLPGTTEDSVYYCVKRTINGGTVRYLEKWAMETECQGGALNKQADAFLTYEGVGVTTITGLSHLESETVVVWGNGKDLGTKVVTGGQITGLSEAVTSACVGLGYEATLKSAKLAFAAQQGTALTMKKRIENIGLMLYNTHYQGLQYGPDFDTLDDLPLVEDGAITAANTVWESFDSEKISFNGAWDTDSRICLKAAAPRPCTILGAIIGMTTNG